MAAGRVMQLATGYMVSAALHAAVRLDVASHLRDGPRNVAALAPALADGSVDADSLHRVLRALATHGVFEETAPGVFGLNDVARSLLPDAPASTFATVRWLAEPLHLRAFGELLRGVKAPQPPLVETLLGGPVFAHFQKDAALGADFNAAMTALSSNVVPMLLGAYPDFADCAVLADVGGGHGALLASVLRAHPHLRGVLFDLPPVVAGAHDALRAGGVADRVDVRGGSFFEAKDLPRGDVDAVIMKHIIHDWDEDKAAAILTNVRAALQESRSAKPKRVLLVEFVLEECATAAQPPALAPLIDLEMLVFAGGRERTRSQFEALLARGGLRLHGVSRMPNGMCVLEARIA